MGVGGCCRRAHRGGGIQASVAMGAAYDEDNAGNAVAITVAFAEQRTAMLVMHLSLTVSTLLLLIFAAGLHRQLRASLPEFSILPSVAAFGLVLTSAGTLLGTGLDTELLFGLSDTDKMVPEVAVFASHWMGTILWLWVGAGLSGLVVAVAALRHREVPRWLGWTSLMLGGLTTFFGISPLQYMAGFVGPVWVLPVLHELGLTPALSELAANHARGGFHVELDADLPADMAEPLAVAAYGIAFEAILNARRHSGAGGCRIRIVSDGNVLALDIFDEGTGLGSDTRAGVGTQSMRERARGVGGTLRIDSGEYRGTVVRARLPWRWP